MRHQYSSKNCTRAGFTLVELSIVIVIIGLITGGIVISRSLIRQSEIKTVLSEYDMHLKSVKAFQDKYLMLPGDFSNASVNWSGVGNGNGNSLIGNSDSSGSPSDESEWFLAWQHLSLAGLTQGQFTGTAGSGGSTEAVLGSNVPRSKFPGGGWTLLYFQLESNNASLWGDAYGHIFVFGGNESGTITRGALLAPKELLSLDQKIDDSKPGTGKVRAWRTSVQTNCTENDSSPTAATYKTSNNTSSCSGIFLSGF